MRKGKEAEEMSLTEARTYSAASKWMMKSVLGEKVRYKNGEDYEAKLFPHFFLYS